MLRIDKLKTGVDHWAGPWGTIIEAYRAYAHKVGFHVDVCPPRRPEHKGKVENKVGCVRRRAAARDATQRFIGLAAKSHRLAAEYLGRPADEAMTAAVLDRLLHKSEVLNIRSRSYRLQELEKELK